MKPAYGPKVQTKGQQQTFGFRELQGPTQNIKLLKVVGWQQWLSYQDTPTPVRFFSFYVFSIVFVHVQIAFSAVVGRHQYQVADMHKIVKKPIFVKLFCTIRDVSQDADN